MDPSLYQPGSTDASNARPTERDPDNDLNSEPALDTSRLEANQSPYDWLAAQQPLATRWDSLTGDDFEAVNGDRQRFVERLANRLGVPPEQASNDLAVFETRKTIRWRSGVPTTQTQ